MSRKFICDITGQEVNQNDKGESVIANQTVTFQGKTFNVSIVIRIDAGGIGYENTNIHASEWPAIFRWVKNRLAQVYG